jgi:predicted DNA-binding protein (UPF0251 family)
VSALKGSELEELKSRESEAEIAVNLAGTWKYADYTRKKEVAMLMIHRIVISENGDTKVIWNL